ncbi:MAG TPA: 50S ribosomal protein L18 [Thermoanaerobaculia bacterium]|nr:50S ribosomal protein L18 [Thermoanaerobaculia bacterium]
MSDLSRKRVERKRVRHQRARNRVRRRVQGTPERPRLSVHKSSRYIYAQIIDDLAGTTLAHASSLEGEVRGGLETGTATKAAARAVGAKIAERAKAKGVEQVVFDRGGYIFHGRVKELADGAREAGLRF